MAYSKMTVADFKKRLAEGSYETATGARRAIGKAGFSDDEKTKCQKLIAKHFGEDAPATTGKKKAAKSKKAAPAKAAKAEKAAKAAPTEGKKRGRKPKTEAAATESKKPAKRGLRQQELFESEEDKKALHMLHLSGEVIGNITHALAAMKLAKELKPNLNVDDVMEEAGRALSNHAMNSINLLNDIQQTSTEEVPEGLPVDPVVMHNLERSLGASQGLPGHPSPVQSQSAVHPAPSNGQVEHGGYEEAPAAVVSGPAPIS